MKYQIKIGLAPIRRDVTPRPESLTGKRQKYAGAEW